MFAKHWIFKTGFWGRTNYVRETNQDISSSEVPSPIDGLVAVNCVRIGMDTNPTDLLYATWKNTKIKLNIFHSISMRFLKQNQTLRCFCCGDVFSSSIFISEAWPQGLHQFLPHGDFEATCHGDGIATKATILSSGSWNLLHLPIVNLKNCRSEKKSNKIAGQGKQHQQPKHRVVVDIL